jgi:hypothetical protein
MKFTGLFLLTVVSLFTSEVASAVAVHICGTTDRERSYAVNDPSPASAKRKVLALCRKSSQFPADCGKVSQCRAYEGLVARFSRVSPPAAKARGVANRRAEPRSPSLDRGDVASRTRGRTGTRSGDLTRYQDGSYSVENGDMTRYSDGSFAVRNGDMTRYSDGSYSVKNGDLTRYSDGSYSVRNGNTTRYSDGRFCVDDGNGSQRCN